MVVKENNSVGRIKSLHKISPSRKLGKSLYMRVKSCSKEDIDLIRPEKKGIRS
jgi:hypothetical protein